MTRLLPLFFLCCLAASVQLVQAGDGGGLAAYLQTALERNDEIRAARARLEAAEERIRRTGVLPDPRISVQYYLEPIETRTGPQNSAVALSQTVPWFGKLALRREQGEIDAIIAARQLAAVELKVARRVKTTYVEYGLLGQSIRIVGENLEILRYLESIARTRYAAGSSSFVDVLKIQIEMDRVEEQARDLNDQTVPRRIDLNNLLGSAPEMARPLPDKIPVVELPVTPDELLAALRTRSPKLAEARQVIDRAEKERALAERDFYPDLTFSLKTIFTGEAEYGAPAGSGDDPVIAGVTLNLPIFTDRRHGAVAEQSARILDARHRREQLLRELTSDVEQLLYRYREAQRKIALFRDSLVPKIRQELEVALEGFQSGTYSILELMDAQRGLLDFELEESRALAERAITLARLEELSGMTLARWEGNSSP
ncbi:TolC family protein [Thermodesulfobacteriota bacterium B35]